MGRSGLDLAGRPFQARLLDRAPNILQLLRDLLLALLQHPHALPRPKSLKDSKSNLGPGFLRTRADAEGMERLHKLVIAPNHGGSKVMRRLSSRNSSSSAARVCETQINRCPRLHIHIQLEYLSDCCSRPQPRLQPVSESGVFRTPVESMVVANWQYLPSEGFLAGYQGSRIKHYAAGIDKGLLSNSCWAWSVEVLVGFCTRGPRSIRRRLQSRPARSLAKVHAIGRLAK